MTRKISTAAKRAHRTKARGEAGSIRAIAKRLLRRDGEGLKAHFVTTPKAKMKGPINLAFLEGVDPETRDALAEGYTLHCLGVPNADRRYNIAANLRNGFVAFLVERGSATRLVDIDEDLLTSFKAWLDDPDHPRFNALPTTRREKFMTAQWCLAQLVRLSAWNGRLSPDLRFEKDPYPKAHRALSHIPVLTETELERVYVCAADDVERTISDLEDQWSQISALDGGALTAAEAGSSPIACAAFLKAKGLPAPGHYEEGRRDARFVRDVSKETYEAAERILYPDLDRMLPMILLISATFAYNAGSAFGITKNDYRFERFLGVERLRLYPEKARAGSRQRHVITVTDEADNPGRIMRFVERWTADIRGEGELRAFLRFSHQTRRVVAIAGSDAPWTKAMKRFTDRHGLPIIQIKQMRPTVLDLVHELSGGDIMEQKAMARHKSAATTYRYYNSDAMKRRNRERLADVQSQRHRAIATSGKVDVVDRIRSGMDMGAATPGFRCMDPKYGMMRGWKAGTLCGAYGLCPICPLASVDGGSALSFAFLTMLSRRISEAQARLGEAWLVRWAPVQEALHTRFLPLFEETARIEGARMSVPHIPHVE